MHSMSTAAVMDVRHTDAAPGTPDVDLEVERARQVLSFFRDVTGESCGAEPRGDNTSSVRRALDAAQAAVIAQLRRLAPEDFHADRLLTALSQLTHARANVHDALLARRAESMTDVQAALDSLRSVETVADLLEVAPREMNRVGYQRCLISRLRDGYWLPRSGYARNDANLVETMIEVGANHRRAVDNKLIESEMVRRRVPLLVRDAMNNDRVHPELQEVVRTHSYVAAPIISRNVVVGFVHADSRPDDNTLDEFDRETLAMFANGFSVAFERVYYQDRLRQIQRQLESACVTTPEIFEPEAATTTSLQYPAPMREVPEPVQSPVIDRLTKREVEVLMHMASGETNKQIATRLFVSEATVKAHVKHILRKLGAANRAEAVSRYLRGC